MKKVRTAARTLKIGFKGICSTVDESVMDWDYTPEMLNYRIEGGVLTGKLGFMNGAGFHSSMQGFRHYYPDLPEGVTVEKLFHYRRRESGAYDDRLVMQTAAGELYYTAVFANDTWHLVADATVSGDASAVSYNYGGKDVLLISARNSGFLILDDATVKTVPSVPRFSSVTVHNERVYGTLDGESRQLWFSDDFDPENWNVSADEGGYISFADECGDALLAVSFLGYLFIFREHGIYRLTAYGDQSEFSLKKLFTATGRIYKDTIVLCGDRIMFLTDEGVFSFDGYSVTPSVKELPPLVYPSLAMAAYHDGAYFLACTTSIGELAQGVYTNNAVVRYDIREGDMCITAGKDVTAVCGIRSHTAADIVFCIKENGVFRLASVAEDGNALGTALKKVYRTPFNDLATSAIKTVRDVTLTTSFPLQMTVLTDDKKYVFELPGSDMPQTVFVGKSGRKIGLEFRSQSGICSVSKPVVRLDVTV